MITATDRVWMEVKDGAMTLKQGELAVGEAFQVPATAVQPTLTTAKAEALRITVGTTIAPPIGPSAEKIRSASNPTSCCGRARRAHRPLHSLPQLHRRQPNPSGRSRGDAPQRRLRPQHSQPLPRRPIRPSRQPIRNDVHPGESPLGRT